MSEEMLIKGMLWKNVYNLGRGTELCLEQRYGNSYKVTLTEEEREDEIVAFRLLSTRSRLVNLSARTAIGCPAQEKEIATAVAPRRTVSGYSWSGCIRVGSLGGKMRETRWLMRK